MTFEQWKEKLDELVAFRIGGLTTDDLPDMPYRAMYDQGMAPDEALDDLLEENGVSF